MKLGSQATVCHLPRTNIASEHRLSLTRFRGQRLLEGGAIRDAEIRTRYPAEFRCQMVELDGPGLARTI